jgi:nicotinamide-nucleotide amidase
MSDDDDIHLIGQALQQRGESLAVAESLTGIVKHTLLKVPAGPVVSERAAATMAAGAGRLLQAGVSLALTGVGGPGPQDGIPPGTVWVATWPESLGPPVLLSLDGPPEIICQQACRQAARLLTGRIC